MNQNGEVVTRYTVLVDGKEYTTTSDISEVYINAAVKVRISNGSIFPIEKVVPAWVDAESVDAIDAKRIKIDGKVYEFSDDAAIYFKNYGSAYTRKGIGDLVKEQKYGRIAVYFDQYPGFGGKVKLVIVTN